MRTYHIGGILCLLTACLALQGGGTVKKEDVPKYLKMLQTSNSGKERALAAEMLGKRGAISVADVKDAIEPLKTSLVKDVDANVRKAAATALGAIGAEPKETVSLLTDVVRKDASLDVKLAAALALGQFGPDAKSALPAINELAASQKDNKKVQILLKGVRQAIAPKKT